MKYYIIILFLATSLFTYGQFSKAKADILSSSSGPTIISLQDTVPLAIGPQESGWYPVTIKVFVAKKDVSNDSVLTAKAELLNADKEIVGFSEADIKVEFKQAEKRGFYKYYQVLISGYIKSYDVVYSSIPEQGLEKILNQKSMAGRAEQLEAFYKWLGFEKHEFESFTTWVYLDKAASLEEPTYRTIVLMRSETNVYGIISRHSQLDLNKIKDQKSDHTGNYFFFQRPPAKTMTEIENIVYSFIPL